jgi:hypothetical protein
MTSQKCLSPLLGEDPSLSCQKKESHPAYKDVHPHMQEQVGASHYYFM